MTKHHVGLLGGTFDPVHQGHIRCAQYVLKHCQLDEVRLMPCHLPPHRATPGVSARERAAMVKLAIQASPQLKLETLELDKHSPSYTVDSLTLLKTREPQTQFYFIIGMDSLCYFRQWKDWQRILQLAHLLVCQRPGYSAQQGDAPALLQQFGVADFAALQGATQGHILLLDNPLTDISASLIRQQLQANRSDNANLAPAVLNYIQQQQLYQA
ncbi:MAG: nicotinate-nucleotide adenylyltransferase [Rheinheimera sp.]|nr:nicotinate-nucleotide adenylyltransferase [Rheinheimera sp.]